jgi:hypothetical protein
LPFFFIFETNRKSKSCRTKVVPNECPQLSRLQLLSIFEFEIFPYKNSPA